MAINSICSCISILRTNILIYLKIAILPSFNIINVDVGQCYEWIGDGNLLCNRLRISETKTIIYRIQPDASVDNKHIM